MAHRGHNFRVGVGAVLIACCSVARGAGAQPAAVPDPFSKALEASKNAPKVKALLWQSWLQGHCYDDVAVSSFPWQIALEITNPTRTIRCSGTLIGRSFVLTAAHCIDKREADTLTEQRTFVPPYRIVLRYGSDQFTAGRQVAVAEVIPAPGWRPSPHRLGTDAALVRLAQPITDVQPIAIRTAPADGTLGNAWIVGWGRREQNLLLPTTLGAGSAQVMDTARCRANAPAAVTQQLDALTICTQSGSVGPCPGDSGGALIVGSNAAPQLIGVSSRIERDVCGFTSNGQVYGMFTAAAALTGWLQTASEGQVTFTSAPPGPLLAAQVITRNPDPHCKGPVI